jgi:hypothetical protein
MSDATSDGARSADHDDGSNFRARARAVRAQAQATLREMRSERRARARVPRAAAPPPEPPPEPAPAPAPEVMPEAAPQVAPQVASLGPAPLPVATAPARQPPLEFEGLLVSSRATDMARHVAQTAARAPAPEPVRQTTPAAAPERITAPGPAAPEPAAMDAKRPLDERREDEMAPSAAPMNAEPITVEAIAVSNLSRLPGVGPGLIWLLHRADILSLADLAVADPVSLSSKLGVVGTLLDLGGWIALAARLEAENEADLDPQRAQP